MSGDRSDTTLWCIHVPGPDDLYAAESYEAAMKMALDHNEALKRHSAGPESDPLFTSCLAHVQIWPWSAKAHAEDLARAK